MPSYRDSLISKKKEERKVQNIRVLLSFIGEKQNKILI